MDFVQLTAAQCRYMHLGPSADGAIVPQGDLTIETQDDEGWIFVSQTKDHRSEGSGVWVDLEGHERNAPHG